MAISAPHYHCLKELHRRGELPQGGALLEIGEANWYGDVPQSVLAADALRLGDCADPDPGSLARLIEKSDDFFWLVKAIYCLYFQTTQVVSIDLSGTPDALKLDLNQQIDLERQFSTVYNHGTLEHLFNPCEALRTMHNHCRVGGLMIHESPFTGWIDHGFYTIQPTLYFDLAAANGYQMVFMAVTHIEHGSAVEIHSREQLLKMAAAGGVPNNSMLYVAMRKVKDEPFKIPMQGFYAETLSAEAHEAWRELR